MPKATRQYFKETRLQQVRAFCETARTGTFSASAAALGVSRPAVWQQIRALERQMGAQLVRRKGRGVELTEDGWLLWEMLAPLLAGFDSIPRVFADRKSQLVRHLTVATTPTTLAHELIDPIREYRERFPHVLLSLIDGTSADVIAALESGRADFGIAGPFDAQPLSAALECAPLFAKPFWLVCQRGHPLEKSHVLRLAQIVRHPLIIGTAPSRWRTRIELVLHAHELLDNLQVVLETNNPLVVPLYVTQGLGVSLLPLTERELVHYRQLCVRPAARWFGEEKLFLMKKKGAYHAPHVEAFAEIVRQNFASS